MGVTVDVKLSGPVFNPNADRAVQTLIDDCTWTVGTKAYSEVHMLLDQSIRNPTPFYETQIIQEKVVDDVVVHDRGVIYGPWLEGVGSRNRTTRFKGYSSFRRATQNVDQRVPEIVRPVVDRWVRGMN